MTAPKLAVIGASYLQLPLIRKAQAMGCEVHAFAWECGDVGEEAADVFHPISIVETDRIVDECRRVGVDGACTIASDLATLAVCEVADALGLAGNSLECMRASTDKGIMRAAFKRGGDPSPGSVTVAPDDVDGFDCGAHGLRYPLIVKPTDRSGSRGVTKLEQPDDQIALEKAMRQALEQSFDKRAVVEEFAEGDEFSIEGMSWQGEHTVLAVTRKGTTGAPHFIETSHLQPSGLSATTIARVTDVVTHALDTLGVSCGASHSELKIAEDGTIRIIEIGARMGGDCIGSHLVELSTGIDFVGAVVNAALGKAPDLTPRHDPQAAAAVFLFDQAGKQLLERVKREHPDYVRESFVDPAVSGGAHVVTDSSTRLGYYVMAAPHTSDLAPYLPEELAAHTAAHAREEAAL